MKIAVLADLHLVDIADTVKENVLEQSLKLIAQKKSDVIVCAGDMISASANAALKRFNDKLCALNIPFVFAFTCFAWIFFRMPDFNSGIELFLRIFTSHDNSGLFIDFTTLIIGRPALFVVLIKEICEEIKPGISLFNNKNTVIRWMSYIIVTVLIILLGV